MRFLFISDILFTNRSNYISNQYSGVQCQVLKAIYSFSFFPVHPLIKVSNQLVAAPVGSNVDIGCDVEASPKAMNSWYRDTGKI